MSFCSARAVRNWSGGIAMSLFGFVAFRRFQEYGQLLFLLLALRDGLCAIFFVRRKAAQRNSGVFSIAVSVVSAGLPLLYFSPAGGYELWSVHLPDLLSIIGYLMATLALIELGVAFGISPAARGPRVKSGIYRWTSHPMYLGYVIAEFGCVLLNPNNIPIYLLSCCLYFFRATKESELLRAFQLESV